MPVRAHTQTYFVILFFSAIPYYYYTHLANLRMVILAPKLEIMTRGDGPRARP